MSINIEATYMKNSGMYFEFEFMAIFDTCDLCMLGTGTVQWTIT